MKIETIGDVLDEMDAARGVFPVAAPKALTAAFRLDITPAQYFAEPCEQAALTSSGCSTILDKSPKHFWHAHPALGNADRDKSTAAQYRGSLVHRLALGKGSDFRVLDFADFRTNAAKEARDQCEADDVIPVLPHKLEEAETMAAVIRQQIEQATNGMPYETEAVIIGYKNGVHRRCMVDVWCPELALGLDVKTAADISDMRMMRAFAGGYARQNGWYLDLIDDATGEPGRNRFAFLFVEGDAPHLGRTASMTEAYLTGGRSENWRAENLFRRCMESGEWPGPGHYTASPPSWKVSAWLEAEMEEE